MNNNQLKDMFDTFQHQFDIEEPNTGHQSRFLEKLQAQRTATVKPSRNIVSLWKPFLGIAASIALIISISFGLNSDQDDKELASISPEMEETQRFFSSTITLELEKLEKEKSPEVQTIIQDALKRLEILEKNYETLKLDLTESGDDHRVIYAMISNFQNRIDLLQLTLQQIEDVKQLKNNTYENTNTI